jgi:hypothetical protein
MSEEAPVSNDVEMAGSIFVPAQDEETTTAEPPAATSNAVGPLNGDVMNEPVTVARVGGEGGEAGTDKDGEGLEWMDEGFVENLEMSPQVDPALYADYSDTFGNVHTRTIVNIVHGFARRSRRSKDDLRKPTIRACKQ